MDNGYTPPPANLSPGFEWLPAYNELLAQVATTNVVEADWPILRDMLKYKLSENIKTFLDTGPPWPLAPELAYDARGRAFELLDSFSGPPFTIQRLCELTLSPRTHYSSLPKYLRAVNRATAVTSTRASFTEDDVVDLSGPSTSSASLETVAPPGAMSHTGVLQAGGVIPTRRPAAGRSPMTSPKALPVVVPLLSPIPWLVKGDDDDDSMSTVSALDLSSHSPPRPASSSPSPATTLPAPLSPSSPSHAALKRSPSSLGLVPGIPAPSTATPTGGVVDEVDPGSGGAETTEPVALTTAVLLSSPPTAAKSDEQVGSLELPTTSLAERFVRASSPRVETSPTKGEEEDEPGMVTTV